MLSQFIEQLSDTGQVRFESPSLPSDLAECSAQTQTVLHDLHRREKANAAYEAPDLLLSSAHQGAVLLYRLGQFLVFREIPAESVTNEIQQLSSSILVDGASAIWSIDLCLRHLPAIYRLAANASTNDPLVASIVAVAARFPLSSVGIPLPESPLPSEILKIHQHPTLSAIYIDRIIATASIDRLGDVVTRRKVREALGHFSDLAPKLACALAQSEFPT
ncbi:MAG: hypothetical protein L3J39_18270 [Verrucomicrobiales bacterium]|nr:hypothetical protein [Verrucomicrobiales bacterium]